MRDDETLNDEDGMQLRKLMCGSRIISTTKECYFLVWLSSLSFCIAIYPDDDYVHNSQSPSFMTSHLLMKKFRVTFNNNMILHNIFLSVFSLVYKCRCDFYINFKMSNFYHYDHHIIIFYFFIFL